VILAEERARRSRRPAAAPEAVLAQLGLFGARKAEEP
jgi:hypothetical protein